MSNLSRCLRGDGHSIFITFCPWRLLLACRKVHITSSTIISGHGLYGALLWWRLQSVRLLAFLIFACDGHISGKGGIGLHPVCDSPMLGSLPFTVCDTLEIMCFIAALHDSSFNWSLSYLAYCSSYDVHFPLCMSSTFYFCFEIGVSFDVPLHSGCSTGHGNEDGLTISDLGIPASHARFVAGDFNRIPTILALVGWFLSEYNLLEVPGLEEPSEALGHIAFDAYASDAEIKGEWELFYLTAGLVSVIEPRLS